MSHVNLILRSLFVLLLCASPAFAQPSVSVISSGNGVFTIQGNSLDGVAGIELMVKYDIPALESPKVDPGSLGGYFAANPNFAPDKIKIAIISTTPFSGNGLIAKITFASHTGTGKVAVISNSFIDSKTAALPRGGDSTSSDTSKDLSTSTGTGTGSGSSTPAYLGTVTLPTDQLQRTDSQPAPAPSSPAPASAGEPPATKIADQSPPSDKPAADAKPVETPQYVVYKGISDRFKLYNGSKKLSAIALLFNKEVVQTIHQEPAIVLSSGQNKATLTVDIPARISTSPNVAVSGGKLVSFKKNKQVKGRWTVEVLPKAGDVKVTMTIIAGAEEFEYPLTVAPPIKTALTLDESGWNRFLREVGTAKAPLHDLNNDGVRNYMDEFIFVANYIVNKRAPAKPMVATVQKKKTD